jgi:hypothetical protein
MFFTQIYESDTYKSYTSEYLYYKKGSNITRVKSTILDSLLPEYCFYVTNLRSNDMGFRDVSTIIAINRSDLRKSVFTHSPVYTSTNEEYLSLFYGIQVRDSLQRSRVIMEISKTIAAIVYEGRVEELINHREANTYSTELWHMHLSWNIHDFYFDESNRLYSIKIRGGVRTEEMWDGYIRKQK